MRAHVHSNEIKAWAEGAQIQVLVDSLVENGLPEWVNDPAPKWYVNGQYRVKPTRVTIVPQDEGCIGRYQLKINGGVDESPRSSTYITIQNPISQRAEAIRDEIMEALNK